MASSGFTSTTGHAITRALLKGLLVPGVLALAFAASAAEPVTPAQAPTEQAASTAPVKTICKKERRTGSQMLTKVCRTQEQINADREAAREALANQPGSRMSQRAPSGSF